jgi:hypothetical protein
MTTAPFNPPAASKPNPNIYTVLLIVGIVAVCAALGVVLHNLMADPASGGYGLTFGQLFSGIEPIK